MTVLHNKSLPCSSCSTPLIPALPEIDEGASPKELHEFTISAIKTSKSLSLRIGELEKLLSQCKTAKANLNALIARHQPSVPAPLPQLPTEIWADIFQISSNISIDPGDFGCGFISASIRAAPLNIASTCKTWRRIALGTPTLWTNLEFFIKGSLPSSKIQLLDKFVARSRNAPLLVALQTSSEYPYRSFDDLTSSTMKNILSTLISQSYRWKEALLKLDRWILGSTDIHDFPIETPILESFCVETEQTYPWSDEWDVDILTYAPILKDLVIRNFRPSVESFKSLVYWPSLTELCFGDLDDNTERSSFTIQEALFALETCPNLITLRLSGEFSDIDELEGQPLITHSKLEYMYMYCDNADLLSFITLPALEHLTLHGLYDPHFHEETYPSEVATFFTRAPSLKTLKLIDSNPIRLEQLVPSKSSNIIPSIETLVISAWLPECLGAMTTELTSFQKVFLDHLPALKNLEIKLNLGVDGIEDEGLDGAPLAHALQAAAPLFMKNNVCLRVDVSRSTVNDTTLDAFNELKSLSIEGLEVTVADEIDDCA